MFLALVFAIILLLLGVFSIRRQIANLRRLKLNTHIASEDARYLRRQAFRRIVIGGLSLALAGMLAGVYFSGMEDRADRLGQPVVADPDGNKAEPQPADREFVRFYVTYWITILVLIFLLVSLAIVDLWATRRYAWNELRRIQSEHRTVLERDLAMYRQQKLNDRMRRT